MSDYTFDSLPLSGVRPGTLLLLTGRKQLASDVARRLVTDGHAHGEGGLFVSTSTTGQTIAEECAETLPDFDPDRLGIVDVTRRGEETTDTGVQIESLNNTADLTGISIKLSVLNAALRRRGIDRVRTCFDSVSVLLLYSNLKTMTRFVNALGGQITAADGLGVFVLEPEMHDKRVVHTLRHLCDGRIEVRTREGENQIRAEGLRDQPTEWTAFSLDAPEATTD